MAVESHLERLHNTHHLHMQIPMDDTVTELDGTHHIQYCTVPWRVEIVDYSQHS